MVDFISGVNYWAFLGTFYLLYLTYTDIKNKMVIDDRKNYFMMGVSVSLISHIDRSLWFFLFLIFVVITLGYFLNKYKIIGGADTSTLTWVIYGFGIINIYSLGAFSVVFGFFSLIYVIIKSYILRIKEPTPFYPVILFSFMVIAWAFGIY